MGRSRPVAGAKNGGTTHACPAAIRLPLDRHRALALRPWRCLMKQSDTFLRTEGDGFFRRNAAGLARLERNGDDDPVLKAIESLALRPKRVLEIGCSNGWR